MEALSNQNFDLGTSRISCILQF